MNSIIKGSWFCAILAIVCTNAISFAQSAEQLSQVKKVYVDSLGSARGAAEMREQLIHRLRKSRDLLIVPEPKRADAVIRGTGQTWVTGHVSLSPHPNSPTETTYEGFLSVEVVGKNDDVLWSYLVIPRNFAWNGIADDLARQLVTKLQAAIKIAVHQEPDVAGSLPQIAATLKGAGATFPAPIYRRWFELFEEQNPKVHISYDAVGSAEGIHRLEERQVDFGASEMPLSDQVLADSHLRVTHIPVLLGAVVVTYNLPGVHRTLNFTPEILSGIYLGKIKKWNDPEIEKANRGAALPHSDIVVVHRSDGSGTTFVWSDYLSKVSPEWKASVGSGATLSWPVGAGAEGNEGVAAAVKKTPNSIGYVEFIYAIQHELSFGTVRNAAGLFIRADIASVSEAAATTKLATTNPESRDFRVSITNPPGKTAYPIATYTWLLLPEEIENKNKKAALMELLRWVLTSGQKKCSALGYAPLPVEVAKRVLDSFY